MLTVGLSIVDGASVEPAASVPGGSVPGTFWAATHSTGIVPLGWVTPPPQATMPATRATEHALSSTTERRRIGCRTLSPATSRFTRGTT
jgi:hypothetical protein